MKRKSYLIALAIAIVLPVVSLASQDKIKANDNNNNGQNKQSTEDGTASSKNTNKQDEKLLKQEARDEKQALKTEDQLAKAKEKALAAIDKRIQKVKSASERLMNRKRLQEQQRATIQQETNNAIAKLEQARVQVENASDMQTVRTALKNAMNNIRVNAVIGPKVKALSMVSALNNAIARLEKVFPKIQEKIAKLPADQQTQATTLLNEAKALLPDVKTKTNQAWNEFSLMKSSDTLAASKTHLEAGKTYFRQAKDTIKQIVQKLNQIKAMFEAAGLETETPESPAPEAPQAD